MGGSSSKLNQLGYKEDTRLQIKFEDDCYLVGISGRRTIEDVAIKAVQMYKKTTGKDVSVTGLKVCVVSTAIGFLIRTI